MDVSYDSFFHTVVFVQPVWMSLIIVFFMYDDLGLGIDLDLDLGLGLGLGLGLDLDLDLGLVHITCG